MPKATGCSALSALTSFKATQWFTKSFVSLVDDISARYGKRNEVVSGILVTAGTHKSATVADITTTAGTVTLNGSMFDAAAISDKDCIDPEATGVNLTFGEPIFSDGSAGDALDLATDAIAYISLIIANSDGGGSTSVTPKMIAVIAGTGASPTATAQLSTAEINSALAASTGVHAGVTSWCHVAQLVLDENSGSPTLTATDNRNNVLGA